MLFAEEHARLLLVAHAIIGAAIVAVSTHLVVWMRGFPRGRFQRVQATRKFAMISASLFVLSLLLGNAIYPVYKVRVRAEYLEQAGAVVRDYRERQVTRGQIESRHRASEAGGPGGSGPSNVSSNDQPAGSASQMSEPHMLAQTAYLPRQTAKVARWFDVKEHWAALGTALALACMALLLSWNPKKHSRAVAPIAFLMALGAAFSAWLAAIIGIVTTSYRSIGGL